MSDELEVMTEIDLLDDIEMRKLVESEARKRGIEPEGRTTKELTWMVARHDGINTEEILGVTS